QAALLHARDGRVELELRDALAVDRRRLAGDVRLQRLGVLVGRGKQQLVAHAELVEQLAAARALRGEVDECVLLHSRWYGWLVDNDHARYSASASSGRTK